MKLTIFVSLFLLLLIFEFFLRNITKIGKKKFKWLIDYKDENPKFEEDRINLFIRKSFDKELGWIRKANTSGKEENNGKTSFFKIDKKGSRFNPNNNNKYKKNIITLGDSFTFCRQVNNNQTWQAFLAKSKKLNVSNYGVGNYGADQALILSKRIIKNKKFNISILGVVPETILRINSCWKHYYEYGNIFGFKPRFIIKDNKLNLIKNEINSVDKFKNYKKYLNKIQKNDYFYKNVFKKEIIKKPYVISYLKSLRNIELLFYIFFKKEIKTLQKFVLRKNHLMSIKFYKEKKSVNLLYKIICEFFDNSIKNNTFPFFIILPQIYDVEFYVKNKKSYYENLIFKFIDKNNIIDLTPKFASSKNFNKYYINDNYGGHLSPLGNMLVAKEIEKKINTLF
jgi:hypothetical protein